MALMYNFPNPWWRKNGIPDWKNEGFYNRVNIFALFDGIMKRKGTCKMRNETRNETCETERNELKRNEIYQNKMKRKETKRNVTERNKMKLYLSKWNETKQNYTMFISDIHWGACKMG